MKLTFWGAAQTVTGSMHELAVGGRRYLLDCGTYQGRRQAARERNSTLPFPAESVEAVVLSHAHIDHSGNLPTLARNGFRGPIWTSPATADLCEPMLLDSAHLQEKDAEFLNKRTWRRKALLRQENGDRPVQPVYTTPDAEAVLPLFRRFLPHTPTEIDAALTVETFEAGHMLGSTTMVLEHEGKRLAYSGDVGRRNLPIIPDPEPCPAADYLILESTYGDRLHKDIGRIADKLRDVVNRTSARGGRIVVPAFAVGRTQQLVYLLNELSESGQIASIPVFVDSPLAVKTTQVFRAHLEAYDAEGQKLMADGDDPFMFRQLRYIQDVQESKALNDLRGPFVVISASGMCEAGRILHHLRNSVEDPRNTVLITGFQAEHTLGRKIVERHPEIPIFGDPFRLRAEVVKLNELSGHADQRELLAWIKPVIGGLRRIFLVHGEPQQQWSLARAIEETYGVPVTVPARGESFEL
ncbi:MAG TPA: MBL fold metallo-hydrolase [Bryobacteraceae bacterium]|nr:MBL fold metallo-hydrolase [Bryobacteraceae bacterium]